MNVRVMRRSTLLLSLASLLFVSACSDAPKPAAEKKKEPEAPPEAVTGSSAFFKMYTTARGWAPDVEGLQLQSIHLPEVKAEPGKAGAWRAKFVSARAGRAKTYSYSVIEAEGGLHKGVFAGGEEAWSGPKPNSRPFPIQALKVDSNAAYETAVKKGKNAAEYIKKNPDMNIAFLLEQTNRFPDLTWRVIWGESVGTSNFSVFVDASTGEALETMR
jgi:hypothetical protein